MKIMERIEHLKQKWGIDSNWDFFVICVVFSISGSAIVFVRRLVFALCGFTNHTPLWIKAAVYIPIIFPCYQVNLLIFGFLFGQFEFFFEKEKKLCRFISSRIFR